MDSNFYSVSSAKPFTHNMGDKASGSVLTSPLDSHSCPAAPPADLSPTDFEQFKQQLSSGCGKYRRNYFVASTIQQFSRALEKFPLFDV